MAPLPPLLPAAGVLAVWILAVAALPAKAQDRDDRIAPEVSAIHVRGNENIPTGTIRQSIATRASRCRSIVLQPFCLVSNADVFVQRRFLDRTELTRDLLRIRILYWRRGFRETLVDSVVSARNDDVEVTFRISEGPPTTVARIAVLHPTEIISEREVAESVRLRAGDPLDLEAIDSTKASLRDLLFERGYADAVVHDSLEVNTISRTAVVRLEIEPRWLTRVGDIRVFGLSRISEQTVLNLLELQPGDIFRQSALLRSQQNLYVSNLFRQAEIRVPVFPDSIKPLDVLVQESPLREARASGGFNTVEFFQVEGRFTHYYAFGGPRRLDIRGAVGNLFAPQLEGRGVFRDVTPDNVAEGERRDFLRPNWQAGLDVVQPWFLGRDNTLGAGIFSHRRSAPGIFIDVGTGAHTSFSRRLGPMTSASALYRFELTEVRAGDLYFCVNYGVCEFEVIDALRGRNRLSPLNLSLVAERADDPLDPRVGSRLGVELEHASAFTVSDYRYNRAVVDYARYWPTWRMGTFAARVRVGWVGALPTTVEATGMQDEIDARLLHPRKRFYAGGARSVRGYPEQQLGPSILTVDPEILIENGCSAEQLATGECPALHEISSEHFQPRPVGATSIIEGNVEFRFHVWRNLFAAFFVDGAILGEAGFLDLRQSTQAITPGFGARYASPVGPIRVDLGIRPVLRERLPVVTQVENAEGMLQLVQLLQPKDYDPLDGITGVRRTLQRMTLHISIGQAF